MKKNLLLTLCLTLVVCSAVAKNVNKKLITFGPKIGLSITDIAGAAQGESLEAIGAKATFTGGVFVEVRPVKFFSVSLDVLYARLGASNETSTSTQGFSISEKNNYKLDYINTPLMFNFYVLKGLALKAGIQPGFLLSAQNKYQLDGGEWDSYDLKEGLKKADWTLPVGVSYTFGFGLMIDARYSIPLTNLANDLGRENGVETFKNRAFTLSVGWKF